jgi:hypothetical protein
MHREPRFGMLALVTYGLVILFTAVAAAGYFYYRSQVRPGDQAEADPTRRILVGAVWVPVYEAATYFEPGSTEEKAITQGAIRFRTQDPAGSVLAFYEAKLRQGGFLTHTTGDAGGTVQAIRDGGRTSVTVSVTSSSKDTSGEIRTLHRAERQ